MTKVDFHRQQGLFSFPIKYRPPRRSVSCAFVMETKNLSAHLSLLLSFTCSEAGNVFIFIYPCLVCDVVHGTRNCSSWLTSMFSKVAITFTAAIARNVGSHGVNRGYRNAACNNGSFSLFFSFSCRSRADNKIRSFTKPGSQSKAAERELLYNKKKKNE